jgi:CubicO group peptidase (beta-lactamase class C family)
MKKISLVLLPTLLGVMLFTFIYYVVSAEMDAKHPTDAISRDYWPNEGWQVADPKNKGLDSATLAQASQFLQDNYPHVSSFTVIRDGYIVWERFLGGRTNHNTQHDLHSVTKSVVSTLIEIAIYEGYIESVDQPILDFFPEYLAENPDTDKGDITIQDLLTMRSGIEWDEADPPAWVGTQTSWISRILSMPMAHAPGEVFNYSSADSHLLSAIIAKATGRTTLNFAGEYLLEPLGINNRQWRSDIQGINWGGTGLYLTSRNMAAIGLLYLGEGYWNGEYIFPPGWQADATRFHVSFRPNDSEGTTPAIGYGYQWWLREQGGYESYMAIGYGGQYIVVIPELDLVVVLTGAPLPRTKMATLREITRLNFSFFEDYIIPAVIQNAQ